MRANERARARTLARSHIKHALQFNWNPIDNILAYYVIVFDYSLIPLNVSEEHLPFGHASSFLDWIPRLLCEHIGMSKREWVSAASAAVVVIIWIFVCHDCVQKLNHLTGGSMRFPNRNRKVISVRYIYNVCFMYADCSRLISFRRMKIFVCLFWAMNFL